MLYFDTSFLAPLILEEKSSARIERFVAGLPVGELTASHWNRAEFSSLLAREVRMGGLKQGAAREADHRFETMIAESFVVLLPSAADYDLAKRHLAHYASGLRAGDALHLAIASNHGAETVYSLDKGMVKAGRLLGLTMSLGPA